LTLKADVSASSWHLSQCKVSKCWGDLTWEWCHDDAEGWAFNVNIRLFMFQEIIFDQEFVFGDLNMFWAQLSPILVWSIRQVLKWVLRRAQNIFMPKKNKLYCYYYHFWGHWENENWKNDNITIWRIISLTNAVMKKMAANTVIASRVRWAAYTV